MPVFNVAQTRAILSGFLDIHRRMAELEALLSPGAKPTPFAGYVNDLSPTEAKVIQDYFERIRTAMLSDLRESEITLDVRTTSVRWAIDVGISFIGINVAELGPKKLRGYGNLGEKAFAQATKFQEDLERLVDQAATYIRQGAVRDLSTPLATGAAQVGVETLSDLEKIVTSWQLVEFRPAIEMIVSRLEVAVIRDRGLWAGELRKILSSESHRRRRCPPGRRDTCHRRSHANCVGGQAGGGCFIRGVREACRGLKHLCEMLQGRKSR